MSLRSLPAVRRALRRLPPVRGRPVRLEFAANLKGSVHAATYIRQRRMVLDSALLKQPAELERILIHELFHFTWLHIGNRLRRSFEELLAAEAKGRSRGELGWSAQWRRDALAPEDRTLRTRRWRAYACESFCDTAAWLLGTVVQHDEFTLRKRLREARREWFRQAGLDAVISI